MLLALLEMFITVVVVEKVHQAVDVTFHRAVGGDREDHMMVAGGNSVRAAARSGKYVQMTAGIDVKTIVRLPIRDIDEPTIIVRAFEAEDHFRRVVIRRDEPCRIE